MTGSDPTVLEPTAVAVAFDDAVTITYTGRLAHRCPFVEERDRGLAVITWATGGHTIELHSLTRWLATFEDLFATHEHVTVAIAATLNRLPGILDVTVQTQWHTAGAEVTCAVPSQRLDRVDPGRDDPG